MNFEKFLGALFYRTLPVVASVKSLGTQTFLKEKKFYSFHVSSSHFAYPLVFYKNTLIFGKSFSDLRLN